MKIIKIIWPNSQRASDGSFYSIFLTRFGYLHVTTSSYKSCFSWSHGGISPRIFKISKFDIILPHNLYSWSLVYLKLKLTQAERCRFACWWRISNNFKEGKPNYWATVVKRVTWRIWRRCRYYILQVTLYSYFKESDTKKQQASQY